MQFVLVTIISSLISGLVGVFVSAYYFTRLEKHKMKMDTARRLLGHRYDISGAQFSAAMNEVFIIFADSPKVISAMQDLYQTLSTPGKPFADDKLVTLLKAVCSDVGIVHKNINDAYFIKTFNARS